MRKLTFQPGNSFFHQLYPLDKLIWLLLLSALVLIVTKGLLTLLLALLALISLIWLCPEIWKVRGFRLVFFTGIFLFVVYLLFEKTGTVLWDPGINFFIITQMASIPACYSAAASLLLY